MYTEYGLLRSNSKFPSGNEMQCTNLARLLSTTLTWRKNLQILKRNFLFSSFSVT